MPDFPDIMDVSLEELTAWLGRNDIRPFRSDQVFRWIYMRQADTFAEMTDLSKPIRERLDNAFRIGRLARIETRTSDDGTLKYLWGLHDGNRIESVLIPEKNHQTICISTQVGCAQGCRFCMTGRSGLTRNLSSGEIVSQIRDIRKESAAPERITNIVMMGMGEPLANYSNVVKAIRVITDATRGLGFSTRRVTVSTAGWATRMIDFGRDTSINLAVSLNAVDNETRNRLMPINQKFPIEQLLEACRLFPLPHRRRITFEYILIRNVNDSADDARKLARLLQPIRSKINLIPFNPVPGCEFDRPEEPAILRFQEILIDKGYTVMIRNSKGRDIAAACGQLRAEVQDGNRGQK